MSLQVPQSWEYRLLNWAQEALNSHTPHSNHHVNNDILEAAYRHCDGITKAHSRTFYMASALLPAEKRSATRALYAFCRITDNIVDSPEPNDIRYNKLMNWKRRVMLEHPPSTDLVAVAWANARSKYHIPSGYAEQLIDGVARDLNQKRYETFEDLADYAYGVASTVGLMAMHIIGFSGEEALPYAVKLGVALQLTNILRDIEEDRKAGRIYLPQNELAEFGINESTLQQGIVTDEWRALMRFQIERTRRLYDEAQPGIAMLSSDGRFAIAAASDLYEAILQNIEAHDYDVFNHRAYVSLIGKLSRLPGIWLRSRS